MADYAGAQAGVLGSMLIDPRTVSAVVNTLQPDDFDKGIHRDIFCAFRSLFLMQEAIDPVTVLNRMGANTEVARNYVLQLMELTATAANLQVYIQIVQEETRLKSIRGLAMHLATDEMGLDGARAVVSQLQELMVDHQGVEALTAEQGILDFYEELERKPEYIPTYIDDVDEILRIERSDYIVLGGYPSDGKTALALSMAYDQSAHYKVGFFSLETKSSKLFNRIFTSTAGVSNKRLKSRTLTEEDNQKLAEAADVVRQRSLTLVKASSMTTADIRAYSLAKGFDIIYIDYLTLISDDGYTDYDRATNISRALHALAQDCGIVVMALSQLARPDKSKGKQQHPTMSSVRSSGQIEQDADAILLLYREEPDNLRSRRILRLAKNKEGETGTWPLAFDGDLQRFTVVPPTPGEQYNNLQREIKKAAREAHQQVTLDELPMDTPIPVEFGGEHTV